MKVKDVKPSRLCRVLSFAYKSLAVYKCALRLPLFCLSLNLDCELVRYFMRGLFDSNPPPAHGFIPSWDLSDLLLRSDEFFPLESNSWYRLSQKSLDSLLLIQEGGIVKSQPCPEIPTKEVVKSF